MPLLTDLRFEDFDDIPNVAEREDIIDPLAPAFVEDDIFGLRELSPLGREQIPEPLSRRSFADLTFEDFSDIPNLTEPPADIVEADIAEDIIDPAALRSQVDIATEDLDIQEFLGQQLGPDFGDLTPEELVSTAQPFFPDFTVERAQRFGRKTLGDVRAVRNITNLAGARDIAEITGNILFIADLRKQAKTGSFSGELLQQLLKFQDATFESRRQGTFANEVANVVTQMVPFGLEIFLTGGLASAGRAGATKVGRKGLQKLAGGKIDDFIVKMLNDTAQRGIAASAARGIGKTAVRAAQEIPAAAARSPVFFGRAVAEGVKQSKIPTDILLRDDEDTGKVLLSLTESNKKFSDEFIKAFVSQGIEFWSEGLGANLALPALGKLVNKLSKNNRLKVVSEIAQWVASKKPPPGSAGSIGRLLESVRKGVKFDGFLREWLEEDAGQAAGRVITLLGEASGIESLNLGVEEATIYQKVLRGEFREFGIRAASLAIPAAVFNAPGVLAGATQEERFDTLVNEFSNAQARQYKESFDAVIPEEEIQVMAREVFASKGDAVAKEKIIRDFERARDIPEPPRTPTSLFDGEDLGPEAEIAPGDVAERPREPSDLFTGESLAPPEPEVAAPEPSLPPADTAEVFEAPEDLPPAEAPPAGLFEAEEVSFGGIRGELAPQGDLIGFTSEELSDAALEARVQGPPAEQEAGQLDVLDTIETEELPDGITPPGRGRRKAGEKEKVEDKAKEPKAKRKVPKEKARVKQKTKEKKEREDVRQKEKDRIPDTKPRKDVAKASNKAKIAKIKKGEDLTPEERKIVAQINRGNALRLNRQKRPAFFFQQRGFIDADDQQFGDLFTGLEKDLVLRQFAKKGGLVDSTLLVEILEEQFPHMFAHIPDKDSQERIELSLSMIEVIVSEQSFKSFQPELMQKASEIEAEARDVGVLNDTDLILMSDSEIKEFAIFQSRGEIGVDNFAKSLIATRQKLIASAKRDPKDVRAGIDEILKIAFLPKKQEVARRNAVIREHAALRKALKTAKGATRASAQDPRTAKEIRAATLAKVEKTERETKQKGLIGRLDAEVSRIEEQIGIASKAGRKGAVDRLRSSLVEARSRRIIAEAQLKSDRGDFEKFKQDPVVEQEFQNAINAAKQTMLGPAASLVNTDIIPLGAKITEQEARRYRLDAGVKAGDPKFGEFDPKTLNVRLYKGADISTAIHELTHALLELDRRAVAAGEKSLFTEAQREAVDKEHIDEESFAQGVAAFAVGKGKKPGGILASAYRRAIQFLKRVAEFMGLRKTNLDDVFEDILAGRTAPTPTFQAVLTDTEQKALLPGPNKENRFNTKFSTVDPVQTSVFDETISPEISDVAKSLLTSKGLKAFLKKFRTKDVNTRPDLGPMDTILSTIAQYSDKVPALRRMFEDAMDNKRHFHERLSHAFNDNEDGSSDQGILVALQKKKPKAYKRLKDYLWKRDINRIGGIVKETGGVFSAIDEDGKTVISTHDNETDAWMAVFDAEISRFKGDKEALKATRMINFRVYSQLEANARRAVDESEREGTPVPAVLMDADVQADLFPGIKILEGTPKEKLVKVDIFEALRVIGDLRGSYMPRMRGSGRFLLFADKKGANPELRTFDSKRAREAFAAKLELDGYKTKFQLSERPSEEAFSNALDVAGMQDVINNVLAQINRKQSKVEPTIEEFGYSGQTSTTKNGNPEFVLSGPNNASHNEFFKSAFGGRFFRQDKAWHFVSPVKGIEKKIAQRMAQVEGTGHLAAVNAFSQIFTTQIATLLQSRGSRARKISRGAETGKDVFLGFERDPIKAISQYAISVSAGTAKAETLKKMVRSFTGTDIPWSDFKDENLPEGTPATGEEHRVALEKLWVEYQSLVDSRRVDSATQPRAFKDGQAYIKDIFRNDEQIDRVMGIIKGVATLKFLSGLSPGVVNLTAMGTTVPASMLAFADIPLTSSPKLLTRSAISYVKYWNHRKNGKGKGLAGDDNWAMNEIVERGWDEAAFNMEAMGVLSSRLGQGQRRLMDVALLIFSSTERLNRGATILGAFNGIKNQHQGEFTEKDKRAALNLAKKVSDKAHAIYGKENLPAWARGAAIGPQVARSFLMYKTFAQNYMLVLGQMGVLSKRGLFPKEGEARTTAPLRAFLWQLLSPAIVAGGGASLAAPALAAMASVAGKGGDDPEEALYEWIENNTGSTAARFARTGLAGGLFRVDLRGSLAIGVTDLPTSIGDVLGAPAAVFTDVRDALQFGESGNILKALEKLIPLRALTSKIKAGREITEGITGRNNQPIFFEDEQLKSNWYSAMLRSLSFNPEAISGPREKLWKRTKIKRTYTALRSGIFGRVRRFILKPAANRTKADWTKIMIEIEGYNARVDRAGYDFVPRITRSTLRGISTRVLKSSTRPVTTVTNLEIGTEFEDLGASGRSRRRPKRTARRGVSRGVRR